MRRAGAPPLSISALGGATFPPPPGAAERGPAARGIRRHAGARRTLRREVATVETSLGQVRVKLGRLNGEVVQAAPEYESCREVAAQAGVPLKEVYAAAQKALEY